MPCEWIRRISFFQMFFLLSLYKNFIRSPFLGWCLKCFGSKFTDSRIPGLKGDSLFFNKFFFCVCKCRFIQIRMFFLSLIFLVSHFWILLALIGHCDSLLLRFFLSNFRHWHWKILSRWHPFLFRFGLSYLTNPVLIIFHCPLSLHQIHPPPTARFT